MNILRTVFTALALGLVGLPALADGIGPFDLPRIEFPAGVDVSRSCADLAAPACTPIDG